MTSPSVSEARGRESKGDSSDLKDELAEPKHQVRALEERMRKLEVREVLLENPDGAGDEPIRR